MHKSGLRKNIKVRYIILSVSLCMQSCIFMQKVIAERFFHPVIILYSFYRFIYRWQKLTLKGGFSK